MLKYLTLIVFALSLVVNGLAGTTVLGGNTTAQVSDSYPNLFAPAGITFAIWGVIYLLLTIWCVRMFVRRGNKRGRAGDALVPRIMPLFLLVSLINGVWLLAWQYRLIGVSVVLMIGLLAALATICLRIRQQKLDVTDRWMIAVPFQVYFGWITVATIANVTTWLVSMGWNGGIAPELWTAGMLIVGAGIAIVTAWRLGSMAYLAVLLWAYGGIVYKHIGVFEAKYVVIITVGFVLMAGFAVTELLLYRRIHS